MVKNKIVTKKNNIKVIVLIILILVALIFGVKLVQKSQDNRSNAATKISVGPLLLCNGKKKGTTKCYNSGLWTCIGTGTWVKLFDCKFGCLGDRCAMRRH